MIVRKFPQAELVDAVRISFALHERAQQWDQVPGTMIPMDLHQRAGGLSAAGAIPVIRPENLGTDSAHILWDRVQHPSSHTCHAATIGTRTINDD